MTSPYLNRPIRTLEQARADAAKLRGVPQTTKLAFNPLAVHMANATPGKAARAAHAFGLALACLFISVCLAAGVGLLSGILSF